MDSVLTRNGLKLNFYPDQHGLTRIDSMDSILTENDRFGSKRPETQFLPRSTCFDMYWSDGLGFDRKWPVWLETARNSIFITVNMVWPVLTQWTRFWPKITDLTRNDLKLNFYPGRHSLTRIDPMDLFFMENSGWPEKYIFEFSAFFSFFGFLWIIIKIK